MLKMRSIFPVALLLLGGSVHAMTGNQLHEVMQKDHDLDNKLIAVAYVAGLTDGIAFAQYVTGEMKATLPRSAICMPQGSQVIQAYDIIKADLAANPSRRHMDAGVLSVLALNRAWPCR